MMPPANSHEKADGDRDLVIGENANTTSQPIPMYKAEESQCGQFIQQILKMAPTIVIPHTVASNGMPTVFGSTIKQIGV